jgi:prevent-host-death family protein
MQIATATEVQNNFGRFLQAAMDGQEVIITRNGKEVARLLSRSDTVSFLTDSLTGVLKHDYDGKSMMMERYEAHAGID